MLIDLMSQPFNENISWSGHLGCQAKEDSSTLGVGSVLLSAPRVRVPRVARARNQEKKEGFRVWRKKGPQRNSPFFRGYGRL